MTALGFVLVLAWRESRAAGRRLLLLTAAVSIGVGALVAINSFTDNLRTAVEAQSRSLMGADIQVRFRNPPTVADLSLINSLALTGGGTAERDVARVTGFGAMAYVPRTAGTRLVRATAIDGPYPFYGQVHTLPAGAWASLTGDRPVALVDPAFLTALNARVGDTLSLGEARFVIAATVENFPGDVGIEAAFGPRVFFPGRFLADTKLLGIGSRAEYMSYVRVAEGRDPDQVAAPWRSRLLSVRATLTTVSEDTRELKRFLEQLGRYLGLVALIALLLGGIGVGSAVQVFIRQKRDTIAILRCLGATSGRIFGVFLAQALAMGLLGSLAGVGIGLALQLVMPAVFGAFLPVDVSVNPTPRAIGLGLGVGVWVAAVFALLPLLAVRDVPPLEVLRGPYQAAGRRPADRWIWLARLALAVSVVGLAAIEVADLRKGAIFAAGIGAALLILWLAAVGLIRSLKRWFPRRLPYVWRQGLANLYRPANQTVAVVLALGFGAFLLGALALVQNNLLRDLALNGGVGQPNLVFFDIQPDQIAPLDSLLRSAGLPPGPAVPMVPMRLLSVKGKPVSEILKDTLSHDGEGPRGQWAFRREYRSTYRDTTVASEKVVVGDWWPRTGRQGAIIPISMEVDLAGELDVTLRDTLVWDVQGVQLTTRVLNLREVNWARFEPNFFVVFPSGPLNDAPQMAVILTRVDDAALLGTIQRRVVERFPNVTSIDLTSLQQTIERIVSSVILAVRFMALFSLATGTVVLIGALATSRFQRVREAVLLKTLGATRGQVLRVMLGEYAALGVLAALVALLLASAGGWALMKYVFETRFSIPWAPFGVLALSLVLLTLLTGLWNSVEVFRRTPLEVLREE